MDRDASRSTEEAARLAALRSYDILDTAPEAQFERLAELAADLFDAPFAMIALVDEDRLWFKARLGVTATEAPRALSVCGQVIDVGAPTTFAVEDASRDPRYARNPMIAGEPGFRFFAGAALISPEGHRVGTLCVVDDKPRPRPDDRDLARLEKLARVVVDELEARRVSRALTAKSRLLEMAESMAGVGSWRYEVGKDLTTWSPEVYRIHGLAPGAFDPNSDDCLAFYHEDDQAEVRRHFETAVRLGTPFSYRRRLMRRDGAVRIVLTRGECELDADGRTAVIHGVFQDVTESELMLRRAQQGESRFRGLAASMPDVVTRLRLDGTSDYASPAIEPMLGYRTREMSGFNAAELVHPDDRPLVSEVFDRLGHGQDRATVQHRVVRKDGSDLWVETNFNAVSREGPGEIVAVTRDIDERRRLEQALIESEARYRLLSDHSSDILIRFGPDGVIHDISPACRTLGFDPEKTIGGSVFDIIAPAHVAHAKVMLDALIRDQMANPDARREYPVKTRDGRMVWLESSPQILLDDEGRPFEVVSVLRDVTRRKAAEEALSAAKVAAEAAAEAKSQFLANMSHELRTPLTAVVGFARLVAEQAELSDVTRGYVDRLASGAKALMATVNDILDFSKLEAGQVEIRRTATPGRRVFADAVAMFDSLAPDRGVTLTLTGLETLPATIELDEDRVRQVLLNLIGNAVKFTSDGRVDVEVAHDAETGRLSCGIRDTGPGIAPDMLSRLFQRFSQVDGSLSRTHGGTGLGLAICKGLVEAMGGRIAAESAVGEGSRFWFEIPAPAVDCVPAARAPDSLAEEARVRVLVAEDNPVNRELVRAILRPLGAQIVEAEDGVAAVERASEQAFDVILMDIRMPHMDGREATARIRARPGPNRDAPVLALSADVLGDLSGFDGAVPKPIDARVLIEAVVGAVSSAEERLAASG
ncbi:MAG: PAS domain S-box protein [Pseudomonadota bacterium]